MDALVFQDAQSGISWSRTTRILTITQPVHMVFLRALEYEMSNFIYKGHHIA